MINYWRKCFKNYANFNGRARRKEYWYYALFNAIVSSLLMLPTLIGLGDSALTELIPVGFILSGLYFLATFIPTIAVLARRLHDIGKSGWWYFVSLIPLVGPIWLLVLLFTDSQPGANEYGSNPKTDDGIEEIVFLS